MPDTDAMATVDAYWDNFEGAWRCNGCTKRVLNHTLFEHRDMHDVGCPSRKCFYSDREHDIRRVLGTAGDPDCGCSRCARMEGAYPSRILSASHDHPTPTETK